MPRHGPSNTRDQTVWNAFIESRPPLGASAMLTSCKFCTKYSNLAVNGTRMKKHLESCRPYLENPVNNDSHIVIKWRQNNGLAQEEEEIYTSFFGKQDRQSKITGHSKLSPEETQRLHELAALAVYVGGRPLSTYDEYYLRAFITRLNPAYKLPSRKAFSEELLDHAYEDLKKLVVQYLNDSNHLNFVTDGSSNINHNRMTNLSVQTEMGALYLESVDIPALRHGGLELAEHIHERVLFWTGGHVARVNSLATDTEAKMRTMWAELRKMPGWEHCLFVPCDSHGIQLLMRHVSELEWFDRVFKSAQSIAVYFWKADKMLAVLRDCMRKENPGERVYALTLSCITRWGTQYRLINSLLRSKAALRRYTLDDRIDKSTAKAQSVNRLLEDPTFWAELEDLKEIFGVIHEQQIMSESGHAHLGYVLKRWRTIESHLRRLYNHSSFRQASHVRRIFEPHQNTKGEWLKAVWHTQFKKQVLPIHYAAFHLDPAHISEGLSDSEQSHVLDFLDTHIPGTEAEQQQVRETFYQFKHRTGVFTANAPCWKDKSHCVLFWLRAQTIAPKLATLALRLFKTPANSVASERAFSIQNLLHNKARNRTLPERMNKLQFLYINARVLRYKHDARVEDEEAPRKKKNTMATEESWLVLDDNREVDLEEDYLPAPEPTGMLAGDDESDIEAGEALEDVPLRVTRTSDVYSLIS